MDFENVTQKLKKEKKEPRVKLTPEEVKARKKQYNQAYYMLYSEELIKRNAERTSKKRVEQRIAEGRIVDGPLKPGRKKHLTLPIKTESEPVLDQSAIVV